MTNFVTGITRVVETWDEIVAAAAKFNLQWQTEIAGTNFCFPPLEDAFGPCANNEANCNDIIAGSFIPPEGLDPFAVSHYKHLSNQLLSMIRDLLT